MHAEERRRGQCHARSNTEFLGTGDQGASPLGSHLDANQRALQRNVSAVPVYIWIIRGQALFGASQRILSALQVNFFRAFGGLRKYRYTVPKNLGKPANDGDVRGFLAALVVIAEFADAQFRHERRVPRQNTQVAVLAGHLHLDGLLAEQLLLRGDNHQLDGLGQHFSLRARLHLLGLFESFFDCADHVKRLFWNVVVLAFHDFLEAAHGVFDLHVLAFKAGELRGDEHRLREKFLDLAGTRHGALVLIGKLFNPENGDDVLQVLVALQNGLHAARHGVVLRADNARIENARGAGQRINRRINAALDDLPAEVGRRVQVRERRGGSRVRVVVSGHVNGLHGSDRSTLCRSDALLQFTDFGVQVRLVAHGRRHAAEKRGNFRACLHKTENVVDEEQHVEVVLVAEIFRNRKAGETHAPTP